MGVSDIRNRHHPDTNIHAPEVPMSPEDEIWAQIRKAYCETSETVTPLCARFSISVGTLNRRATQEGWPRRGRKPPPPRRIVPVLRMTEPAEESPAFPTSGGAGPTTAEKRELIIQRLYDALLLKLTKLERHMAKSTGKQSIDHERETRALDGIVRSLDHIAEYDTALTKAPGTASADGPDGNGAAAAAAASGAAARTEQLRRDIAQRLERLLEKRNPPGDAG